MPTNILIFPSEWTAPGLSTGIHAHSSVTMHWYTRQLKTLHAEPSGQELILKKEWALAVNLTQE